MELQKRISAVQLSRDPARSSVATTASNDVGVEDLYYSFQNLATLPLLSRIRAAYRRLRMARQLVHSNSKVDNVRSK